jgi:serralysin
VGGAGTDWLQYAVGSDALTVNLAIGRAFGAAGNDTSSGIENVEGGLRNDSILGDGGNNVLSGDGGVDTLNGGAGADTLADNIGEIQLIGAAGDDVILAGNITLTNILALFSSP